MDMPYQVELSMSSVGEESVDGAAARSLLDPHVFLWPLLHAARWHSLEQYGSLQFAHDAVASDMQ
jgi:hypothetical protein